MYSYTNKTRMRDLQNPKELSDLCLLLVAFLSFFENPFLMKSSNQSIYPTITI